MAEKKIHRYDPEVYKANKEAQLKANAKYKAKLVTRYGFDFNRKTEADILDKLNTVRNRSGYIKALIRQDIDLYRSGKL